MKARPAHSQTNLPPPSPSGHAYDVARDGTRALQRGIESRNLLQTELAILELGSLSLLDALAYLELLAEVGSPNLERAAVRFHARLATEASTLTLAE